MAGINTTDAFRIDYEAELDTIKALLSKTKRRMGAAAVAAAADEGYELEDEDDVDDEDAEGEVDRDLIDDIQDLTVNGSSRRRKVTGYKYVDMMQRVADRIQSKIVIDLEDVANYGMDESESLLRNIQNNAHRYIGLFSQAVDQLLPEPTDPIDLRARHDVLDVIMHQRKEKSAQNEAEGEEVFPPALTRRYHLTLKPLAKDASFAVRTVKGEHLGKLIKVRGMVTRVSEVKPLLLVNAYSCDACGAEVFQEVDARQLTPLVECVSEECNRNAPKGRLVMQTRACKFEPFQEVKIQEMTDQVPVGHIPRSMTLHLYGPLVRALSPGDIAQIGGIFLPTPYTGFRAVRSGLLTDTYLEVHDVVQLRQSYERLDLTPQVEAQLAELKADPALYSKLAGSIAPEIYGHDDVKRALLLLLVGGVTKRMGDGMKIRGDLNVCLMGDPGVAKSQLLKYISKVAPRGVYTTGRGSSGVGLTAAVMRDPVTDEMVLEGGALVLADNGICCIDEFDKMDESDRTAIHEVMEQQTISIAKAGITTTLNARTSILAAANPLYGRYNPKISPVDNINLPAALLSRFDVMFLILDTPSRSDDERLARHVSHVHMYSEHPPLEHEPVAPTLMRHYIALARRKRPVVPKSVSEYMVSAYVELRRRHKLDEEDGKSFTHTSARTLLAVIRLSQALARLRFSDTVEAADVDEALRLMEASKASLDRNDDDDAEGAGRDSTDVSKIYRIVRDMARSGVGSGARRLGQRTGTQRRGDDDDEFDDDEGGFQPVQSLREVRERVFAKGFTEERLMACIVEYEGLDVWARENNDSQLRFLDV